MICLACREDRHLDCPAMAKDRTWCDCHHDPKGTALKGDPNAQGKDR